MTDHMEDVVRRAILTIAPDVEAEPVEPDEAEGVEREDVPAFDADAVARKIRGLPPLVQSAAYTRAHEIADQIRNLR